MIGSKRIFVAKVESMKVGAPTDSTVKLGAVVSKLHMEKILSFIEIAKTEGGKVLTGGHRVELEGEYTEGYYIRPTVIEGLDQNCRTNQEEIFGPVVSIMPFDTDDEAVALANSTNYGLSATVWTESLSRSHKIARDLDVGIVWVNTWLLRDLRTPFGGVKHSGVGREGGYHALNFFTEQKNICIKYS